MLEFSPEATASGIAVRYGLAGIKNVGEVAMEAVVGERRAGGEFTGVEDFCARLDSRIVNRKLLESLVKSGAFDFTNRDRAELFASIDQAMAAAAQAHRDRASGQASLFELLDENQEVAAEPAAIDFEPWSIEEKLAHEKELLGFYVTGHPLDRYRKEFDLMNISSVAMLGESKERDNQRIAGVLLAVDKRFSKKDGKPFAILQLEDLSGSIEIMVWNDVYTKAAALLEVGEVVMISGKVSERDDSMRITAREVSRVKPDGEGKPLTLIFPVESTGADEIESVRRAILRYPGRRPLRLEFQYSDGRKVRIQADKRYGIELTDDLKRDIAKWLVA